MPWSCADWGLVTDYGDEGRMMLADLRDSPWRWKTKENREFGYVEVTIVNECLSIGPTLVFLLDLK